MLSVDYLNKPFRLACCIVFGASMGACVPVGGPVPVQDASTSSASAPAPAPSSTPQGVVQLNKVNALQAEVRELRNQLEEQQFELENMRQRQQDLFQGLDQRLRVSENIRRSGPENADAVFVSDVGVDVQAVSPPTLGAADLAQVGESNGNVANVPSGGEDTQVASITGVDQQVLYDQGFEHLKQSRYTEAIDQFSALVVQFPDGGLADDASYWIGEANYVNRQYENAIRAFRKVVAQYPSSDRVPEALLKVGYVQYDIGDYDNAKTTFNDVLRRYADHPVAISAKSRVERIERGISN